MSGKFVLKKERGRFRYYLEDENGAVFFSSPFLINKELAMTFIDKMRNADTIINNLAPLKGPDKKWVFRGEVHTSREGEKGNVTDDTPMGFSATYDTEQEMEKARQTVVKLAKNAEVVDET
jgi:uncharacterized protein YegP (UPF0339 family)